MRFVLAAILFTIYFLLFTIPPVSAHSSVTVVKMTPNAFEPDSITVDENSTIIFLNQDEVPRWPASNLHPTHELYPEFDPKKAINPGESWSFKPKKAGVWKFHDHLNPHLRATLTVTPEPEEKNTVLGTTNAVGSVKNFFLSLFDKISSLFAFTRAKTPLLKAEEFKKLTPDEQFKALETFAKTESAEKVWSFITETFKAEAGSTGNIHDLAHLTGKLLYEQKGIEGIGLCTPIFAFGCYHGLLDAAFHTSLGDLPQAEKECEKVGQVGSGPYGSCIHGIGHGVASFHQSKNIEKALSDCDLLRQGRDFCYDGVFMEFVRSATPNSYSKTDPFYPCNMLEKESDGKYSLACGRNQPTVFISRLGLTFEDGIKLCGENSLTDKFKGSCFDALGFMLASTQDVQKIIAGCKSIKNTNYSSLCFKSAAGELIFQNAPNWQEKAPQVCDAAGAYKNTCNENLQRLIREYG
ncbi:MAG: cupredoxin domain-containing protein, partial [Candidatus Chisholmbacteria bacterium]|nr:cupredoxin domain-containing protein [Candidatus Chisholmbacteria bacterium]